MLAILNAFRYAAGTLLGIVFLTIFFMAGTITFFALSAYTSAFFTYFVMIMPFRIMTRSYEDALRQTKLTLHEYVGVILVCLKTFNAAAIFCLAAITPFFKKLKVGYST